MNFKYPPLTKREHERLIKLNERKLPISEIAEKMGRSPWTLRRYFKTNKIKTLYKAGRIFTHEEKQKIIVWYDLNKWSIGAISHALGSNNLAIRKVLEDHDVELRPTPRKRQEAIIDSQVKDVGGVKVCRGKSYLEYLKDTYGKGYRKFLGG